MSAPESSPARFSLLKGGPAVETETPNPLTVAYEKGYRDGRDQALKTVVHLLDGTTLGAAQPAKEADYARR